LKQLIKRLRQLMKRFLAIVLGIILGWAMLIPQAQADQLSLGSQVFEIHCAGCHVGGGNIIRRGKNLKLKTLQRNQMDTIEAISEIVTLGKANMSAYGEKLSQEEISAVASYVLDRAAADWK
jgi:cytochrome c6